MSQVIDAKDDQLILRAEVDAVDGDEREAGNKKLTRSGVMPDMAEMRSLGQSAKNLGDVRHDALAKGRVAIHVVGT